MSDRRPHPILPESWKYSIVHFDWHIDPDDSRNSRIDLTLRRSDEIRKLRFLAPRNVSIDDGFQGQCWGLQILDVRERQWEDVGVEVSNFEQDPGIVFLAKDVVDPDQEEDV